MDEIAITVRVNRVIKNDDETYTILIPGNRLDKEANDMLLAIFPNLCGKVYDLLNIETMLSAIVTRK